MYADFQQNSLNMPQGLPFKGREAHAQWFFCWKDSVHWLHTQHVTREKTGERGTVKEWLNDNLDEINTHLHPQQFQGFGLEKQQKTWRNSTRPCRMCFYRVMYSISTTQHRLTERQTHSHETRNILWCGKSLTFSLTLFFKMATSIRDSILCRCDWQHMIHTETITCGCVFACIIGERISAFGTVLCFRIKAGHVWIMYSWAIIWVGKNSPGLLWGFWYLHLFRGFVLSCVCVCVLENVILGLFHHKNHS